MIAWSLQNEEAGDRFAARVMGALGLGDSLEDALAREVGELDAAAW